MPANLPPEYFAAEKRFKDAKTPAEKIAALEELIATVPKHKGTDKLRADLRARLSKLREEAVRRKKTGKGDLYAVDREGALQIALVGFANAGKSSLLKSLTNASPVIADYPMSTVMPLSGMMPFEDTQFQLVDLPPIGNESTDGWVSGILRNADLLLLVVDLSEDPDVQAELLIGQLSTWNMPIMRKGEGETDSDRNSAASRAKGKSKKGIIVANKMDLPGGEKGFRELKERLGPAYHLAGVSTEKKTGLEDLKRAVFAVSGIIRVYAKEPGREPDLRQPFTLPAGSTALDLAEMIHKEFVTNLKYVCIWGSARFPGQRVQRDYVLSDRDIVEFHL